MVYIPVQFQYELYFNFTNSKFNSITLIIFIIYIITIHFILIIIIFMIIIHFTTLISLIPGKTAKIIRNNFPILNYFHSLEYLPVNLREFIHNYFLFTLIFILPFISINHFI